uniref:Girdin-like isoform X2 n=1 Tax=Petromyzon marinus TaxID=7757 RepID=A0AAJ7TQ31_PETMA|nr:girdin-like isoform X2 [Petromyzon marinus]
MEPRGGLQAEPGPGTRGEEGSREPSHGEMERFLSGALVAWVKTMGPLAEPGAGSSSEYLGLVDGVVLNDFMQLIDPRPTNHVAHQQVNGDVSLRVQNLRFLVRRIQSYYQEILQQWVVMALPSVFTIARDPFTEQGIDEMRKILLLMLGCAVQCEHKEVFIEKITELDLSTQANIVSHIQEVTQNPENVLEMQWSELEELPRDELQAVTGTLLHQLRNLLRQRDKYADAIVELQQERDSAQTAQTAAALSQGRPGPGAGMRTPIGTGTDAAVALDSRQHLAVELADSKAKLRRVRQDLEERSEELLDCRAEAQQLSAELKRLQHESQQLATDARWVRAFRDERDGLLEKAGRAERFEADVERLRERLQDLPFYKARVEELQGDTAVLLETRAVLEQQLEAARARCDRTHELEKERLVLRSRLQDLHMEYEESQKRLDEVLEEKLQLEIAQKRSLEESAQRSRERRQTGGSEDSAAGRALSAEVGESVSGRLIQLETDNRLLEQTVLELQQALASQSPAELGDARPRRSAREEATEGGGSDGRQQQDAGEQDLLRKVELLELELQGLRSAGDLREGLLQEKVQLERTVETAREAMARKVQQLEEENTHLRGTVATLRDAMKAGAEARARDDGATETRLLQETLAETSLRLGQAEAERRRALSDLERQQERVGELEAEARKTRKDTEQLQRRAATLLVSSERAHAMEQENAALAAEVRRLKKVLDALRDRAAELEALRSECAQLEDENLQLRREAEELRAAKARLALVELEKLELEQSREALLQSLEAARAAGRRAERLDASVRGLQAEAQELRAALEESGHKTGELERRLLDGADERERAERLELARAGLEAELARAEREAREFGKESRRLRQLLEEREGTLEERAALAARSQREASEASLEAARLREACARLQEVEREARDAAKQASLDGTTLAALQEELVCEKLRFQQLSADLERLKQQRQEIGPDSRERRQGQCSGETERPRSRDTELLEPAVGPLVIREESSEGSALEPRMRALSDTNTQLREELIYVKKSYEDLRHREDERQTESGSSGGWEGQEATRELLRVKDRLIDVERANATLQAERQAQSAQFRQLETQNDRLQGQVAALQQQAAALHEHNAALQTQNAKLQVEGSALNAQASTLLAQNAQLQGVRSGLESELEALGRARDDLRRNYEALLRDHERLSVLHERQASEYEALIAKHGGLKGAHRTLELAHRELQERYNQLESQRGQLEELEGSLHAERERMQEEASRHASLLLEHRCLRLEHDKLCSEQAQLGKEREELQGELRASTSALHGAQLEHARLQSAHAELKEQHQQLDIVMAKFSNHCELLTQLKGNLEEENRHLLHQVQTMMTRNKELMDQTMESKEQYMEEQKQYLDKLNELRWQKDRLEEKIMNQNRLPDPSPKRKGNWIDKMKKLIKNKKEGLKEKVRSQLELSVLSGDAVDGGLSLPRITLDDDLGGERPNAVGNLLDGFSQKGLNDGALSSGSEGRSGGSGRSVEASSHFSYSTVSLNTVAGGSSGGTSHRSTGIRDILPPAEEAEEEAAGCVRAGEAQGVRIRPRRPHGIAWIGEQEDPDFLHFIEDLRISLGEQPPSDTSETSNRTSTTSATSVSRPDSVEREGSRGSNVNNNNASLWPSPHVASGSASRGTAGPGGPGGGHQEVAGDAHHVAPPVSGPDPRPGRHEACGGAAARGPLEAPGGPGWWLPALGEKARCGRSPGNKRRSLHEFLLEQRPSPPVPQSERGAARDGHEERRGSPPLSPGRGERPHSARAPLRVRLALFKTWSLDGADRRHQPAGATPPASPPRSPRMPAPTAAQLLVARELPHGQGRASSVPELLEVTARAAGGGGSDGPRETAFGFLKQRARARQRGRAVPSGTSSSDSPPP